MSKINSWKTVFLLCVFGAVAATGSPAQTFTSLVSFNGTNGAYPDLMSLVQGTDGNLYGTTDDGGATGSGTVFKVTPTGTLTTLYSFCAQVGCTDGEHPFAGLVLGTNGTFYGTTAYGGVNGEGTVFSITSGGLLTTLHSFDGADGAYPYGALAQGTNGKFYGTTYNGGANGLGTVFSITAGGTLTTLLSFDGADGQFPTAGLIQANNGNFYGTTSEGGDQRPWHRL
jgi:uncharacterized repeat protein (TIGR03803 family)